MPNDNDVLPANFSSPDAPAAAPATDPASVPQPQDWMPGSTFASAVPTRTDIAGNVIPATGAPPTPGSAAGPPGSTTIATKGYTGKVPDAYKNADVSAQAGDKAQVTADEQAQLAAQDKYTADKKAAQDERDRITAGHDAEMADIYRQNADQQKLFAVSGQKADAAGAAAGAKHLDAFNTQMAAVAHMAIDPTGPIASMTAGEAIGMSFANFAQGFLGARYGIKLNVSEQMDKWVDNSIKAQQENIKNARAGAEDQLHLYEIARQTSSDASEARIRYQGLMGAAAQSIIASKAAQFQSSLAASNAASTNADIDEYVNDKKQKIYQGAADRKANADKEAALVRFQNGQLTLEWAKLNAAKNANKPPKPSTLYPIDDPEHPGVAKWHVDAKEPGAKDAIGTMAGASHIMSVLDDLQDKYKAAYGNGPAYLSGDRTAGTKVAEYQRAQNIAAAELASYGPIKRMNTTELNMFKSAIPGQSAWMRADTGTAIEDLREMVRNRMQSEVDVYGQENERGQTVMPAHAARYKMLHSDASATPEAAATLEKQAEDSTGEDEQTSTPSFAWKAITGKNKQPVNTYSVDTLALGLVNPAAYRASTSHLGEASEDDAQVIAEVKVGLEELVDHPDMDLNASEWARKILELYNKDPGKLKELLEHQNAPLEGTYTVHRKGDLDAVQPKPSILDQANPLEP